MKDGLSLSTFLRAEWRKLIMVQYCVPAAVLEPYLPAGVELDLYRPAADAEPRCYVSLVGFLFDRVRVKGIAVPWHTRFEEINLRFYVRRREVDGSCRRGVVFLGEFVPRWAIAFVAKRIYEEPYRAMPTRHAFSREGELLTARYEWKLGGRWHSLSAVGRLPAQAIAPGSEEEFVTEHYWGYTKRSDGSTSAYGVEHARWEMYPVERYMVEADFEVMYGREFGFLNRQPVASVFFMEGAPVVVREGSSLAG